MSGMLVSTTPESWYLDARIFTGFKFFYEFYILRCLKSQRIFAIEAEDFLVFVKFLHTKKVVFSVHNFFCSMHDHFNFV